MSAPSKTIKARTKLFVSLLGVNTSNNMTRLYCAMKESTMLHEEVNDEYLSKTTSADNSDKKNRHNELTDQL